jgi:transcription elongation factor Elf1
LIAAVVLQVRYLLCFLFLFFFAALSIYMSGTSGRPAQRRGNFASRKARGENGSTVDGSKKEKVHGFDARNYHQNANTHGIHALRTFDCPVCDSKNTIRVDLNTRLREGTVRCTYCMSLRPVPEDLPYPYSTSFVPSLENKADVFFKFNEMYTALLRKQMSGDSTAGSSTSGNVDEGVEGMGTRKRPRSDKDGTDAAEDHHGARRHGPGEEEEEDGLLGGLTFNPLDADMLERVVHDGTGQAAARAGGDRAADSAYDDGRELPTDELTEAPAEAPESTAEPKTSEAALQYGLMDKGEDDVDIAEFFADSD